MKAVQVLLLHGINVWNTGDLGLLQITVQRLREELGEDTRIHTEDVFTHGAGTAERQIEQLRLRPVAPILPLRQGRRWGRVQWVACALAATIALLGTRLLGARVLTLFPTRVAAPIRELLAADVVVSKAGGHIYQTPDQILASPTYLFAIWAASSLGRPTVLYAQSVGPFSSRFSNRLAGLALRGVDLAIAREAISYEWLRRNLPSRTPVYLTADEGFQLSPLQDTVQRQGRRELGITVISWRYPGHRHRAELQRDYERALVEVARWWVDECEGDVRLIRWLTGGHREDDGILIQRLCKTVDRPGRISTIGPFDPLEAAERIGQMELLVASRLHSAIFGMIAGTPAVAVEYLPKTSSIMAMAVGEGCTVPIDRAGQELLERVKQLHRDTPAVTRRLSERIPELRLRAQANATLVKALVDTWRLTDDH